MCFQLSHQPQTRFQHISFKLTFSFSLFVCVCVCVCVMSLLRISTARFVAQLHYWRPGSQLINGNKGLWLSGLAVHFAFRPWQFRGGTDRPTASPDAAIVNEKIRSCRSAKLVGTQLTAPKSISDWERYQAGNTGSTARYIARRRDAAYISTTEHYTFRHRQAARLHLLDLEYIYPFPQVPS